MPDNVSLLRGACKDIMRLHPFTIDAFVLLPEHLHCIWTLPPGDNDFSSRWRMIKSNFTRRCTQKTDAQKPESRMKKGEQAIWQRRFWEHFIRDEKDFISHVEYIHYNPVKHGYVTAPKKWRHSSFRRYVQHGIYDISWGDGKYVEFDASIGNE